MIYEVLNELIKDGYDGEDLDELYEFALDYMLEYEELLEITGRDESKMRKNYVKDREQYLHKKYKGKPVRRNIARAWGGIGNQAELEHIRKKVRQLERQGKKKEAKKWEERYDRIRQRQKETQEKTTRTLEKWKDNVEKERDRQETRSWRDEQRRRWSQEDTRR